jgi:hypothetical protein
MPDEICINNFSKLSLKDSPKIWAEKLAEISNKKNNRNEGYLKIIQNGYEIKNVVKELEEEYTHIVYSKK